MLTNALCDGLASSQTRSHSRGSCPIHKLLDSLIACVTTRTTRTKTQPTTGMILHARTRCTINPSSWSQLVISIHSPNRRHHLLSYFATASQLTMHFWYIHQRLMTARYPARRVPGVSCYRRAVVHVLVGIKCHQSVYFIFLSRRKLDNLGSLKLSFSTVAFLDFFHTYLLVDSPPTLSRFARTFRNLCACATAQICGFERCYSGFRWTYSAEY